MRSASDGFHPVNAAGDVAVSDPRRFLESLFFGALDAVRPGTGLGAHLPPLPRGRTIVVGAGKAAASMAAALVAKWPSPVDGLVVTAYGHAVPADPIRVVEAAHPVPDAAGQAAAREILDLVSGLGPDDLVIALISGGGSALLSLPAEGLTLADKQELTGALLKSGAPIGAINTVRKHLSAIKGGRLAVAAHPARVVTLAISDIPGDDPAMVASGPTCADETTVADARAVLKRYHIDVPERIARVLESPLAETPGPGDPKLANATFRFVATPMMALEAAAGTARAAGIEPVILGDAIEGEARDVARAQAALALGSDAPHVFISGGETTVTVRGAGRGGRNSEFALALALALDGAPGVHAIACDTDGIDGNGANAGAYVGPDTLLRARELGLDARALLDDNDAYRFFEAIDSLVVTGPTLTNVNDFRAILVLDRKGV